MYIKVINPKKHGNTIYDNKGSASQMVNYLNKENETKPLGKKELFFNHEKGNISSNEVIHSIDNNRKGIARGRPRFHSLVIAPSADELAHISHDPKELKLYVNAVMEVYAQNFNLSSGRKLSIDDLVWFGKLEYERDGEYENGSNMHIHVIVSARDKDQKVNLSPNTNDKKRFSRVNFAYKSERHFDKIFGYNRVESFLRTHQIKRYANLDDRRKYFDYLDKIKQDYALKKGMESILKPYPASEVFTSGDERRDDEEEFKRKKKRKRGNHPGL